MRSRYSKERGVVLALWALLMVLFIGIGALAVDAGILYMHRFYLTEAATAGAMAVMKLRALQGWSNFHDPSQPTDWGAMTDAKRVEINQVGTAAALMNLRINKGLFTATSRLADEDDPNTQDNESKIEFLFNYNLDEDIVTVEASYQVPTIFTAAVSNMGLSLGCLNVSDDPTRCRVVAPGPPTMQLDPAVVELVLDVSGSMSQTDVAGSPGIERIQKLRGAVAEFAQRFHPGRDYLGLVWFQTAARVGVPLDLVGNNLERFALNGTNGLNNTLMAGGNTNITDGLLQARWALQNLYVDLPANVRSRPYSVVLFSDGAPNVSRVALMGMIDLPDPLDDLIKVKDSLSLTSRCLGDSGTLNGPIKTHNKDNDWYVYRSDIKPQCQDGYDNDNDFKIDYGTAAGNDAGCSSPDDNLEDSDPDTDEYPIDRGPPVFVHHTSAYAQSQARPDLLEFGFKKRVIQNKPSCNDQLDPVSGLPVDEFSRVPTPERNKTLGGVPDEYFAPLKGNAFLSSFDFTLPGVPLITRSPQPPLGFGGSGLTWSGANAMWKQYGPVTGTGGLGDVQKAEKEYRHSFADQVAYYSAIEAADALRDGTRITDPSNPAVQIPISGRIYAIGLGGGASIMCNNPLQSSGDWMHQKPFFLERLALSLEDMFPLGSATIAPTHRFERGAAESRDLTVSCFGALDAADTILMGYTPLSAKPWEAPHFDPRTLEDRAGMYTAVENAGGLNRAFAGVATQILLRLAQYAPPAGSGSP